MSTEVLYSKSKVSAEKPIFGKARQLKTEENIYP